MTLPSRFMMKEIGPRDRLVLPKRIAIDRVDVER